MLNITSEIRQAFTTFVEEPNKATYERFNDLLRESNKDEDIDMCIEFFQAFLSPDLNDHINFYGRYYN